MEIWYYWLSPPKSLCVEVPRKSSKNRVCRQKKWISNQVCRWSRKKICLRRSFFTRVFYDFCLWVLLFAVVMIVLIIKFCFSLEVGLGFRYSVSKECCNRSVDFPFSLLLLCKKFLSWLKFPTRLSKTILFHRFLVSSLCRRPKTFLFSLYLFISLVFKVFNLSHQCLQTSGGKVFFSTFSLCWSRIYVL